MQVAHALEKMVSWGRCWFIEEGAMRVIVAIYGAARVVIGKALIELSFDASSITLGQVVEKMIAIYPRARPYLLDEAGGLPSYMRVLINNVRPDPDATLSMVLHDGDHVALMAAVAGGARDYIGIKIRGGTGTDAFPVTSGDS
jgi:molybdopterin converting factor small subunit